MLKMDMMIKKELKRLKSPRRRNGVNMAKKIRLVRRDGYLVILGVIISFFIQALFDSIHEGQTIFKYNESVIFVGSISTTVFFGIVLVLFLSLANGQKEEANKSKKL